MTVICEVKRGEWYLIIFKEMYENQDFGKKKKKKKNPHNVKK